MQTLAEIFVEEPVQRLIGDNAYDSDQLDRELAETGVEMIAPHRCNRKQLQPLPRAPDRGLLNRIPSNAAIAANTANLAYTSR